MKYIKYLLIMLFLSFINVNADTVYKKGTIDKNTTDVYVRSCASGTCDRILNDTGGKISISYPETFEIIGEEGNFYKIKLLYSGFLYEGYISKGNSAKSFVDVAEYTVLDSTVEEFKNAGFPEDYAKKLAILKTIHPNWNFKKYDVNATFDEVVLGETKYVNTNLIDSANTSLRSTEDGAYADGEWITFEGGWYAVSKQTVKYYLDPRNFLDEGHVFMFEELAFNSEVHTEEVIQSMLNGTFMENTCFYIDDNGEKIDVTYAKAFIDSGSKNGVSSVHLVARAIQEQGVNGSVLSSGTNATYPGYYNFFNVNATGKTDDDIINTGLAYAKKKNWNSPYASIVGGGDLLNKYVTQYGQSTIYLEKFDLAGDNYYSTQYMQNVRAPYSESYKSYKSYYSNNLMETGFLFSIPVFKGVMPEFTSLDVKYSEDASLASLSVSYCNLMPSFTSSATNYTCNIGKDIESVEVNASPTSIYAKVEGTGTITLSDDVNKIEVVVTSSGGAVNKYVININRSDEVILSPDEILAKLQKNIKNNYISNLDYQTDATSFINQIQTNFPNVTAELSENKVLSTGMVLKIKSGEEKNYTLVVYGDNNGDGMIDIIDLLKVQKDILGVNKLADAYREASDVNKDGVVDILDLLKIQKNILGATNIEQ